MFEGTTPQPGFRRDEETVKAFARVKESLFMVTARHPSWPPGGLVGTAVMVGVDSERGTAFYATAAHVIREPDSGEVLPDIRLMGEESREEVSAQPYLVTLHGAASPVLDPDFAVITTDQVPQGTQAARIHSAYHPGRVTPPIDPGRPVLYAGYPVDADATGRRGAMLSAGMVAGHRTFLTANGKPFLKYVVNGMVSGGMSGGPLFCPDEAQVAAIVMQVTIPTGPDSDDPEGPERMTGHGWGWALPIYAPLNALFETVAAFRNVSV